MPGTLSPQITVEIRGADRCGKSVLAQLIRQALRAQQITVIPHTGAEWLARDALRSAVTDLKERGLSVEMKETETAGPIHPKHQIDARLHG